MAINFLVIHQLIVYPECLSEVIEAWKNLNKTYSCHLHKFHFSIGKNNTLWIISIWDSEEGWNIIRKQQTPVELVPLIKKIQKCTFQQLLIHTGPILT